MKKVFKSVLVGALAIPCAYAFTGCGGDNSVNVDTSGSYKTADATTSYTEISTLSTEGSLDFEGIRFTITSNVENTEMTTNAKLNGTAVFTDTGVEVSLTLNGNVVAGGVSVDVNMSMYVHDGFLYVQQGNQKIKIDLSAEQTSPNEYTQYLEMLPNNETIMASVDSIKDTVAVSEKSTEENVVKYHLKGEETADGENECWLIVKDGKFDGFKALTKYVMEGTTVNGALNVEAYTGTIEMPSFDGYVDYTPTV